MARKAKPVWFKPKGGKWHRDPMMWKDEADHRAMDEKSVQNILMDEGGLLESKCGRYGDGTGHYGRVHDCEIRRSKPRNNVCKNCDR